MTPPRRFGFASRPPVPELRLADCPFNADRTLDLMKQAEDRASNLVVFPEMGLTGYTCHDLFHTTPLQRGGGEHCEGRVERRARRSFGGVAVVGLPLVVDGQLFNCAAVDPRWRNCSPSSPRSYLPNYKEFYDARYFAPACERRREGGHDRIGHDVPFGTDILFDCATVPAFVLGVEICEDLWMPVPPSSLAGLAGATVLANLSASNEVIGKAGYRRQLVAGQSGRCIAGYVYASCGVGESTTDLVFGGHCLIAENGTPLPRSSASAAAITCSIADIDLDRLVHDRVQTNSFNDAFSRRTRSATFRRVDFDLRTSAA